MAGDNGEGPPAGRGAPGGSARGHNGVPQHEPGAHGTGPGAPETGRGNQGERGHAAGAESGDSTAAEANKHLGDTAAAAGSTIGVDGALDALRGEERPPAHSVPKVESAAEVLQRERAFDELAPGDSAPDFGSPPEGGANGLNSDGRPPEVPPGGVAAGEQEDSGGKPPARSEEATSPGASGETQAPGSSPSPDSPDGPSNPRGADNTPTPSEGPAAPDQPGSMTPPAQPGTPDAGTPSAQSEAQKALQSADSKIAAIDQNHPGKTWNWDNLDQMRAEYGADFTEMRNAQTDRRLAAREMELDDKRQPGMSAEQQQHNETERLQARVDARLTKDDTFQQAAANLARMDATDRYKGFKDMTPDEVKELSGGRLKDYTDYCRARIQVEQRQLDARYNVEQERAREGYDANGNKTLTTPEQRNTRIAQLESERTQENVGIILRNNPRYAKLKPGLEELRKQFRDNESEMDRMLDGGWGALTEGQRSHYFGDDKNKFRDAQDARAMEREARAEVVRDRAREGFDADGRDFTKNEDGSPKTPKQVEEARSKAMVKAALDNDPGPGAIRRRWRGFTEFMGKFLGKAAAAEEGKRARGLVRRLYSEYGWRGLFLPFAFVDKDKRASAVRMWKMAVGAGLRWAGIHFLRGFFLGIPLAFIIIWVSQPILMGKVLEVSKPFGGNG